MSCSQIVWKLKIVGVVDKELFVHTVFFGISRCRMVSKWSNILIVWYIFTS